MRTRDDAYESEGRLFEITLGAIRRVLDNTLVGFSTATRPLMAPG